MKGRMLRFTLSNHWGNHVTVFVQRLVEGIYNLTPHYGEAWLFPSGDNTHIREVQERAIAEFRKRYPGLMVTRSEIDDIGPETI